MNKPTKEKIDWLKVEQDIRAILKTYFTANIEDMGVCEAEAASYSALLAIDRILGVATERGCEAEENQDQGIAQLKRNADTLERYLKNGLPGGMPF